MPIPPRRNLAVRPTISNRWVKLTHPSRQTKAPCRGVGSGARRNRWEPNELTSCDRQASSRTLARWPCTFRRDVTSQPCAQLIYIKVNYSFVLTLCEARSQGGLAG